jgi:hypothetical protein
VSIGGLLHRVGVGMDCLRRCREMRTYEGLSLIWFALPNSLHMSNAIVLLHQHCAERRNTTQCRLKNKTRRGYVSTGQVNLQSSHETNVANSAVAMAGQASKIPSPLLPAQLRMAAHLEHRKARHAHSGTLEERRENYTTASSDTARSSASSITATRASGQWPRISPRCRPRSL